MLRKEFTIGDLQFIEEALNYYINSEIERREAHSYVYDPVSIEIFESYSRSILEKVIKLKKEV